MSTSWWACVPLVGLIACAGSPPTNAPSPAQAATTAGAFSPHRVAKPTPPNALLVLAKRDATLAIVDPTTLEVLARIPVGSDPHEVVTSADGKTAYVTNYGGGTYHSLAVVDLTQQIALPPVDLGALRGPHGIAAVGGRIWFTAEAAKAIGSYDPASKSVDWVLGTGQNHTHMIFVFEDMNRILTTNVSSATVSLLERGAARRSSAADPKKNDGSPGIDWDETVIPVGQGAEGFDVTRDGTEAWVANAGDGTISVIDIGARSVKATVQANVRGANRLKFSVDGKRVFVSTLRGPDVVVFDAATRAEVKRIPVGHGAAGLLMEPSGARVFVACSPDDSVAVIDAKTMEVVGRIDAGKNPDGLAWAARR